MLGLLVWLVSMLGPPPEPPLPPSPTPSSSSSRACEVEVVGIPVSVMPHHRLRIGAQEERTLASRISLRMGPGSTRLRVLGPRYAGERVVSAEECREGAVVRLRARPLPARVAFPCAPKGLTVACPDCPGASGQGVRLAKDFPPVVMSSFSREIELLFRAPGFRRQTRRVQLHPGPNKVHVQLEPLVR